VSALRVLVGVVVIGLLLVAVDALSDATQNRPDAVEPDTRTTVLFHIDTRDDDRDPTTAADTLWSVCATTISHATVLSGPEAAGSDFAVTVQPALGEHSRRRLVGCLEDATIDGVIGRVMEFTPHPR
jgi:hypothetical protein